jgi:hypothetical protein
MVCGEGIGLKYLLHSREAPEPPEPVPAVKTELKNIDRNKDMMIWLGHSSYFMQLVAAFGRPS